MSNARKNPVGSMIYRVGRVLGHVHRALDPGMIAIAAKHPCLSSLYYACWSRQFGREHQAFLRARQKSAGGNRSGRSNVYLLRRNVHRMEKGLLMHPRRELFALGYVGETLGAYEQLLRDVAGDTQHPELPTLRWAHDTLAMYFDVVAPHDELDALRERFRKLEALGEGEDLGHVPYARDLSGDPPVQYTDLLELAKRRRSVRWFLKKPVSRELIDQALAVAALSPSACNRQPFQFRVFDDPAHVQRIISIPMGTVGYSHNVPVAVVIVGDLSAYGDERDRHLIYIDASLAAMSFILALEAEGLSSCCINWPDIEEKEREMQALLQLQTHERPVMCMALGYPDPEGLVAFSQKKTPAEFRRYNFE